jgi:hypothetical protein
MASRPHRPRRLLVAAVLGAILAGEITGIALARTLPPVVVPIAATTAPGVVGPATVAGGAADAASRRDSRADVLRTGVDLAARGAPAAAPVAAGRSLEIAPRASSTKVASKAPAAAKASSHAKAPTAASYHGVNHVWIPSLGISKGIQSFPCSRTRPPDAGVYRWGCAGANNVYLLSHAWSTFKPLHDAYVRGTLRKGMRVWYADGGGHVHEYRVIWWKVTAPTTASSWAWAALPSPGMTLQTCVGANSQYRLMVRLDRGD